MLKPHSLVIDDRLRLGLKMARHRLDAIDRRILAELQADGRMTNVELARRVKITAPPCLRRVRALEKELHQRLPRRSRRPGLGL